MTSQPPAMATCGACGAAMAMARATYDKNGTLVCPACAARVQIAEGDARAVSSIVATAISVGVGGILSWTCMNAFYIISFITIASAIGWLTMIARAPTHRKKMGGKFVPCMIAVCVGLVLASAPLAFLALGMSVALLQH